MIEIKPNKLYLVTGASGFLGSKLVEYILRFGGKVRAMARDEGNLIKLKASYPDIEIYPGDISDRFEVKQSLQGITGVFHLAASKHVGLAEKFVRENVKTNTLGTLNILEESLDIELEFVLGVSTDKAAQVSGVYGATKFLMERLFLQYEHLNSNCKYRIVRYGNVLYSTGSVLCAWRESIIAGKEVSVTDPSATRFFWSVNQAIELIQDCMIYAKTAEPYCPEMKSMRIGDLLQAMIDKYSNGVNIPIRVIGLQPGENLHEKVLELGPYSDQVEQFSIDEIKQLI
jgi:UDP-N-acetylglucosamine 4,6-dehydratase/UDP-glucose 4-epimerase